MKKGWKSSVQPLNPATAGKGIDRPVSARKRCSRAPKRAVSARKRGGGWVRSGREAPRLLCRPGGVGPGRGRGVGGALLQSPGGGEEHPGAGVAAGDRPLDGA